MRKGTVSNPDAPHLREAAFRAYEDWLIRLTECYPEPLVITPSSPSTYTFSRRIRDAANAFLLGRFESPLNYDDFKVKWEATCVRATRTQVIISPPAIPLAVAIGVDTVAAASPKYLMVLESPTLAQLQAVAALYATGATMQPTKINGEIPAGFVPPEGCGLYSDAESGHTLL